MELGLLEDADSYFSKALELDPDGSGERIMCLAQLRVGEESAALYSRGLALLGAELEQTDDVDTKSNLTQRLCSGWCAVAELYLTDLCFSENAEQQCENAVSEACRVGGERHPESQCMVAQLR